MSSQGQMVTASASQFVKFKDAVLEIGKPAVVGVRPQITLEADNKLTVTGLDETFGTNALRELTAITNTSRSTDKSEQTFNFVGGDGWTDAVHLTKRISQSYTSYLLKDTSSDGLDPALALILEAGNDEDIEVFIRNMFFLGSTDNAGEVTYTWRTIACNALVSNPNENTPGDNIVEVTFDINSVSTVYMVQQTSIAPDRPSILPPPN